MKTEEERIEFLKKSREKVGELYPVLVSKGGKIIDGRHRLQADPHWPKQVMDFDNEKAILATGHTNWLRWTAGQKTEYLDELAETTGWKGAKQFADALGLDETTVRLYLSSKYKDTQKASAGQIGAEQKGARSLRAETKESEPEEAPEGAATIFTGDVMKHKWGDDIDADAQMTAKFVVNTLKEIQKKPAFKADKKAAKELANYMQQGVLLKLMGREEIYCPHCKKSELVWGCCKKPVSETAEFLKKQIDEKEQKAEKTEKKDKKEKDKKKEK